MDGGDGGDGGLGEGRLQDTRCRATFHLLRVERGLEKGGGGCGCNIKSCG